MSMHIVFLAIWFLGKSVILTVLLWIMIKVQKLNCNYFWLLGAAAAGTALDMIPHVGHYLAVPATIFGIWKCTGGEIYPDAVFTVVVAGALMFCVNLFLLGALMGNLSLSPDNEETTSLVDDLDDEPPATNKVKEVRPTKAPEKNTNSLVVKTNQIAAVLTKTNSTPTNASPIATTTNLAKKPIHAAPPPAISYKSFSLKGISGTAKRRFALVGTGSKDYTVAEGEELSMLFPQGRAKVRCESIKDDSVVLIIDGTKLELSL